MFVSANTVCVFRISEMLLPRRRVRMGNRWWTRGSWTRSCIIYHSCTNWTETCRGSWRREWLTGINIHTFIHILYMYLEGKSRLTDSCCWSVGAVIGVITRDCRTSLSRRVRTWKCTPPTSDSLTTTSLCWTNSAGKTQRSLLWSENLR